ncbi:hypothetical protein CLAFUW4_08002 [Fulvia fulva]|uniref:Uncharacterized protein n=1 Tax=Passalora fulva TaxID=5499 RepID=A0A9Q8LDQ8_PASFU|nr:uncharacterized protein CLAFUR5_08124 [Fulvia fulva]KAK4628729.1 hypothetical protein CLAFUR4_08007 [Fulvia fulva]KAK4630022.1 hypothetical protein CLAFUR0_08003 [Fulvia fulva]UJO15528.1 hypothetical protein CLAFUR5_08124 [Fulvia fulva]WPV12456.1 hypothetical protein CLAFUW4_08002 [Fulvia fulva]WPV27603.1 hypothetical protein CLAFUW7_08002 [Fulvia fulva]
MKSSTLLIALPLAVSASVPTIFSGCNYKPIGVEPWYNCNEQNGGSDPCAEQQDCYMACGSAGSNDKKDDFVIVAEWNGNSQGTCNCKCYLK